MEKKIGIIFLVAIILFALVALVIAMPNLTPATVSPSNNDVVVNIPSIAVEVAPNVFDLGIAVDPVTGKVVRGYAILHPKRANTHKQNHNSPGGNGETTSSCYLHLAKGAKWKTVEDYVVDTANNANLSSDFIRNNLASDIDIWEDAADGNLDGVGINIFGNEVEGIVDGADESSPDGKNEVLFADVSSSGAIAVTIVWGIFSGPPFARELVEWDQVYDDVDFVWSETGEAEKMDFWNIAMHELGHAFGVGHPSDICTEETMYRFALEGETKKRDLNIGDITGINALYA